MRACAECAIALACLIPCALLMAHSDVVELLTAPHSAAACMSEGPAPLQEKMPMAQRQARQAVFR